MKTPKKPIQNKPTGKPNSKKEEMDEELDDIQDEKNVDEDGDDFDMPLDDIDTFDSFDDDDDDDELDSKLIKRILNAKAPNLSGLFVILAPHESRIS